MKKYLITLVLFLTVATGFAQDKKSLEARVQKMYELTVSGKFNELMDYTYPKIFEIVPKEQLTAAMQEMLKGNDEFTISILPTPPNFVFGDIKKVGSGFYTIVKHDTKMQIKFNEPMEEEEAEMMIEMFKEAMASDDVTYNAETNSIIVLKKSEVIAAADGYTKNEWMFTNKTKNELMTRLFDQEVRVALGI